MARTQPTIGAVQLPPPFLTGFFREYDKNVGIYRVLVGPCRCISGGLRASNRKSSGLAARRMGPGPWSEAWSEAWRSTLFSP